jgi:hypothetical protein
MLRVQSRAHGRGGTYAVKQESIFRQAPAQILRSICMNADTRQNLSRRSSRQRQSIGPSGRAVRNVQRRRGFGLVVDNVQDRETAVAASRRGVREHAEDHSIRKDLGLASGRERPPREGRGADFRAAEGGRSRPVCIRCSLVGRATRTAQSAVRPRMATAPTVSRESDLRLRAAARE